VKKLLLIVTTLSICAFYGYSQPSVRTSNIGTVVGMDGTESTGFSIYFSDSDAVSGGWFDNNPLGGYYDGSDESFVINLNDDPSGTKDAWSRGDFHYFKSNGPSDYIPMMLGNGNNKVQFTINTPDTIYYWAKIDHTPWVDGNPSLQTGDTIKTIGKMITVNVTLPIPTNLTLENNLNTTFYNTLYLYFTTINRKVSKLKLYEIHVGDQVTGSKIVKPNEVSFGSLLHNSNVVAAEGFSILGQCIGKSQSVAGIIYPKGISFVKATMRDGSSVIAKVYR